MLAQDFPQVGVIAHDILAHALAQHVNIARGRNHGRILHAVIDEQRDIGPLAHLEDRVR